MDQLELVTNSETFNLNEKSFLEKERTFDGILSGDMWRRVKALNSKMPDTFDWSIYDRLYEKFGDEQPRGGVVFKTAVKLVNHHSSCTKCHYAFEIDTYGRGCIHNCSYCYAMESLTAHGYWNRPHPFPLDMSEVRKIFHQVFETDKPSKWRDIMAQKVPLRIGSMSDSFMKMDTKYGVTKELLKILSFYDYPHIIFTRSDLVADDSYMKLLRKDLCSVQFSISGNNEKLTKAIEPGAPSVTARFKALKKLNEAGFWTTVRINPFFPMKPDGYYTDPDKVTKKFGSLENAPEFNLLSWDIVDQMKEAKVPSFLVGVVRLSPHAIKNMTVATGVNLKDFFEIEPGKGSFDVRYSDSEIRHYYSEFAKRAWKSGIRYGTCYIGMGIKDYFQHQNVWSNKADCCDAVGNVAAFKKTSQSVSWDERLKHAPHKEAAAKARDEDLDLTREYTGVDLSALQVSSGYEAEL
ncbi:MAG: radical SAM protein [Pseudobdellovibrionaceae bacterium]